MTKDRDFKRIVRQQAQASGEPYTQALSRLRGDEGVDEGGDETGAEGGTEPSWIVARTIVGVENRVSEWLMSEYGAGIGRVLLPRIRGRNVAPGVLLLEPTATFDDAAFAEDPWIRDFVGAPEPPRRLTWLEVLEFLKGEVRRGSGGVRGSRRFAPVQLAEWSPSGFSVPLGGEQLAELLEQAAVGARAEQLLENETDQSARQHLGAEVACGAAARRKILHAHRSLVDDVASRFLLRTDRPLAELCETGLAALDEAVTRFDPQRGVSFVRYASWWVRGAIACLVEGRAAASFRLHRLPADGDVAVELVKHYEEELRVRFPQGFEVDATGVADVGELTPPGGAFLVVYDLDGRPVGCGGVRRIDATIVEIKRMWIDPETRGRGLGRELLGALEREACARGRTVVRLDTNEHLPEAIGLYRSQGYVEIAAYNDNPYATHWFEKTLP